MLFTEIYEIDRLVDKKIVRAFFHDDMLFLFFEHNLYCIVESRREDCVSLSKGEVILNSNPELALKSGIIDQKAYDDIIQAQLEAKRIEAQQRAEAKVTYEKSLLKTLMAKYPDAK